jgi:hypothetical protein
VPFITKLQYTSGNPSSFGDPSGQISTEPKTWIPLSISWPCLSYTLQLVWCSEAKIEVNSTEPHWKFAKLHWISYNSCCLSASRTATRNFEKGPLASRTLTVGDKPREGSPSYNHALTQSSLSRGLKCVRPVAEPLIRCREALLSCHGQFDENA